MVKIMLRSILFMLMFVIVLILFPVHMTWAAEDPFITAESAILIDAHTGQVLYEKNAHQPRPPASTTKIATAAMALEMGNLDEMATVSHRAATIGESSMHLITGERMTLEQLLTGALVRSGNDACVAISEHLAGTEDVFMRLVTNRVNLLGAENTLFVNSNGLPARGHLSSAYDLALITRYALLHPVFCEIVGTREIVLCGEIIRGENKRVHSLVNTNKLLWNYPGTTGVKTGTTREAGQCLVASAVRDGKCLISVVLHSKTRYNDSIKLLEFGFNNFEPETIVQEGEVLNKVTISNGKINNLPLVADRSLVFLSREDDNRNFQTRIVYEETIEAPIKKGCRCGDIYILYDDRVVGYAHLVAASSVDRNPFTFIKTKDL